MQKRELRPMPDANAFYREYGLNQLLWEQTRADALSDRLRLAVELLREAAWDGIIPVKWHDKYDRLLTSLPQEMRG